jgi:hypothetical protein
MPQAFFTGPSCRGEEMLQQNRKSSHSGRRWIQPRLEPRFTNIEDQHVVDGFCDLARLIRSLQRLEGNPECFGTGQASCESICCAWREYCLEPEDGAVSYSEGDHDKIHE